MFKDINNIYEGFVESYKLKVVSTRCRTFNFQISIPLKHKHQNIRCDELLSTSLVMLIIVISG
jgi:hypothetical protein